MVLEVARLLSLQEKRKSTPEDDAMLRILVPLTKLYTGKQVHMTACNFELSSFRLPSLPSTVLWAFSGRRLSYYPFSENLCFMKQYSDAGSLGGELLNVVHCTPDACITCMVIDAACFL